MDDKCVVKRVHDVGGHSVTVWRWKWCLSLRMLHVRADIYLHLDRMCKEVAMAELRATGNMKKVAPAEIRTRRLLSAGQERCHRDQY
jgi:hypothetical protein